MTDCRWAMALASAIESNMRMLGRLEVDGWLAAQMQERAKQDYELQLRLQERVVEGAPPLLDIACVRPIN